MTKLFTLVTILFLSSSLFVGCTTPGKNNAKEISPGEKENIKKEISNRIDNQFTFNLTPQITEFLNWITSKHKINRADYIRGLIDRARQKSTEYKKFKKG